MGKRVISVCFVFCALASCAFADVVDLSVNTSGTAVAAMGQITIFERFNNPSTGTGVFDSFLRIQSQGEESGYNTDGQVQFATKAGKWTHSITLGNVPVVNGYLEFYLDINQSQGGDRRYLSLDVMKIFLADSAGLDNYDPDAGTGLGTLIYDLGANWVKMDNTVFDPGSGTGDVRVLIPASPQWSSDKYLYLYCEFGKQFNSNSGFEEWSIGPAIIPEPATLILLALGGLMLRKSRR